MAEDRTVLRPFLRAQLGRPRADETRRSAMSRTRMMVGGIYLAYKFFREAVKRTTGVPAEAPLLTALFAIGIVGNALRRLAAPVFKPFRPRSAVGAGRSRCGCRRTGDPRARHRSAGPGRDDCRWRHRNQCGPADDAHPCGADPPRPSTLARGRPIRNRTTDRRPLALAVRQPPNSVAAWESGRANSST